MQGDRIVVNHNRKSTEDFFIAEKEGFVVEEFIWDAGIGATIQMVRALTPAGTRMTLLPQNFHTINTYCVKTGKRVYNKEYYPYLRDIKEGKYPFSDTKFV